jgi:hypothetical protein
MNIDWVDQEHLMAHWVQAMAHFEFAVSKIGTLMPNLGKNSPYFKV